MLTLFVPAQTGELRKTLATSCTLVLLHGQMQFGVLLQVAICGKCLPADCAQMLANVQMGVHVVGEAVLLIEALVADGAMEG